MAENTLWPAFIKIFYEDAIPHTMTFQVWPALVGAPITGRPMLRNKGGSEGDAGVGVGELVNVLKPLCPLGTTFQYWEMWQMDSEHGDPVFRFSDDLAVAGTSTTSQSIGTQCLWSYRTANGGTGRIQLMSTIAQPNQKGRGPLFVNGGFRAVAEYLVSDNSIVRGRDDGSPVVVTKFVTKTNDALRKRYRMA